MRNFVRRLQIGVLAILLITSAVASPAIADDEPASSSSHSPDNTGSESPLFPAPGNTGQYSENQDDKDHILEGNAEIGAVGNTGVATFKMISTPGSKAPSSLSRVNTAATSVSTVTTTLSDGAFFALVVIDDPSDPIQYRFEEAIPPRHSGTLEDDGSVTIFDEHGNSVGNWATPWAFDSNGRKVETKFKIEGTALLQTVDHEGHAYPIFADPCGGWSRFFKCLGTAAAVGAAVATCASGVVTLACGLTVTVAVAAVGTLATDNSGTSNASTPTRSQPKRAKPTPPRRCLGPPSRCI